MNKPKQATLFQSWGSKSHNQDGANKAENGSLQNQHSVSLNLGGHHDTISLLDDEDEEDQELARALEESLAYHQSSRNNVAGASTSAQLSGQTGFAHTDECSDGNISFGIEEPDIDHGGDRNHCLSQWRSSDLPVGQLPGFDHAAGQLWIYPTNYPVREYQLNIVRQALVKNTLVTLPTGLGKTFIAAVIMYNFYRWYPEGTVVFMAPTKPLVAQQIEACYNIMGIPKEDTAEMTGSMNPTERQKAWRDRRVFFLTPQVMTNDLSRGTCIAESIKCVVVDEAHKALGNHAYCQVVRELMKYTRQFRVLALSATPGSDIKSVQNVINNLAISHIELRSEDSPDIKPYTHERTVDKMVVPLGEELTSIKVKYIQVLVVVVRRLIHQRVLYNREATSLSKFLILKAREAFRQNPPESLPRNQYGIVEGDFALAMSLYHGYELLQLHGLRSLFHFLDGIVGGNKSYGRTRSELMRNADFNDIMNLLREKFQPSPGVSSQSKQAFLAGHPKIVKLEEVVLEHFRKFEAEGRATRVMIFSQYRDSVQEIATMLQQHHPQVKVMSFIGQSSVGKATKGFTQKEQLKVMQAFRTGGYNTLVSTCVGEEGLDIGDVDLIVCFDAHKSPIRLVQRMGRTGRKRQGRIVMLVTEGKEEQIYNHSQYTKRSIHRAILNSARSLVFYANNPRMIPSDVTPACHRMHITVQPQQPASKQKVAPRKGKSQGTLHKAFSKAKADKKLSSEAAGISLEEFAKLKSLGAAVTAKHLPGSRMLTLESADKSEPCEQDSTELNLAEWLPWQNALQQTSLFGHSRRSQHLVELLEFTDLQQMLPADEDNYGQEMRIYLDMDDVICDPKRPHSSDITQFVIPTARKRGVKDSREGTEKQRRDPVGSGNGAKTTVATGKRKRKQLPVIEAEQNSDDSDVLPDVDFSAAPAGDAVKPTAGTASSGEGKNDFLSVTPRHNKEERLKTTTQDTSESSDCEDGKHLKHQELASEASGDANSTCSKNISGGEIRIPTPPPGDEISQLLSLVAPEDWVSVDVDSIISACKCPVLQPFSNCVPLRLMHHLDRSSVPLGAGPKNKQRDSKMSNDTSLLEQMSADSLNDSDFDALEEKILGKSVKAKVCKSKAGTVADCDPHCMSQAQAHKVENDDAQTSAVSGTCSVQISQQKVVSQAEPKARKPLFKLCETNPSGPDTSEFQLGSRTDGSRSGVRQKSSFVYSFSQGSSQTCKKSKPVKECESIKVRASESAVPVCGAEHKVSTSLSHECKVNGHKAVLLDDWVTGKQLLQSEMGKRKTSEVCDKSFRETSISDSFFDKNFVDDDGDFEDAGLLSQKSPNLPRRMSTHKSPRALSANLPQKKSVSPASDASTRSPQSTAAVISPTSTAEHIRNNSMLTFTQALACVHNHSVSDPSHSDSNKNSKEDVPGARDSCPENPPKLSIGKTAEAGKCDQVQKTDLSVAQKSGEESPNFDLGFDFDEDIIPPSPEAEASVSQLTGKSLVSKSAAIPPLYSKKCDSGEAKECAPEADDFDDDETFLHIVEECVEEDSPCFSSSFQSKPIPSFHLSKSQPAVAAEAACQPSTSTAQLEPKDLPKAGKRKLALSLGTKTKHEELTGCSQVQQGSVEGTGALEAAQLSSQGFERHNNVDAGGDGAPFKAECSKPANSAAPQKGLSFGCGSENLLLTQINKPAISAAPQKDLSFGCASGNLLSSQTSKPANCATPQKDLSFGCVSENVLSTQTSKPQLKLSSIGASHTVGDTTFQCLEDLSPNFALNADIEDDFDSDWNEMDAVAAAKTPVLPAKFGASVYCSTPVSSKKERACLSTKRDNTESSARRKAPTFSLALEEDDGSDFEEIVIAKKKPKWGKLQFSDDSDVDTATAAEKQFKVPSKQKKKLPKRKRGCDFIDNEAELSDDVAVSSDEGDDNLEMFEGSFIDNCTQMTQASQIDMQAIYMKSVRSPVHPGGARGGRFRLHQNHAPINVYSQLPRHEEDESQYQEDSFCVGSEEEESDYEDSEEDESLMEISKNHINTAKRKKKQAVKQVKGRKRVHQLAGSSSDEEEDFDRLPPSQITPQPRKTAALKALLSSSEDNLDVSALDASLAAGKKAQREEDGVRCYVPSKTGAGETQKSESSQGFEIGLSGCAGADRVEASHAEFSGKDWGEDFSTAQPAPWLKKSLVASNQKPCPSSSVVNQEVGRGFNKFPGEQTHLLNQNQTLVKGSSFRKPPIAAVIKHVTQSSSSASVVSDECGKDMDRQTNDATRTGRCGSVVATKADQLECTGKACGTKVNTSSGASSVVQGSRPNVCVGGVQLCANPTSGKIACGDGGNGSASQQKLSGVPQSSADQQSCDSGSRFTSIISKDSRGKVVILVDSREISGAQDIVSALRLEHNAHVCTRQLPACDYVLSNRLAVERLSWSSFSNGASRSKVSERIQQMQLLYDRCVVIVEKDRVKPGDEKHTRPPQHSKYVDTVLAQLSKTAVRIFFTDNQGETATLLAQLSTVECRKGMAITAPVNLTPEKEQVVKFYLSIPRLTITHALNLCFNFSTIHHFMLSSVNGIQTKGHMSFSRASEVVNFVRHRFSPALMSKK